MQREKRKLVAIVAADIAGYSRLIGQDEEGTLRVLRAHREEVIDRLIEEHGGRIANTAGDSLLLEFPSAVDAVRYCVAMQKGLKQRNRDVDTEKQLRFRIGLHVGDVVADGEDLLGEGVNIAARLEALCEPGGLALSDDAYRQVRDRLDIAWQDGGVREVKNILRPVQVWHWRSAWHRRETLAKRSAMRRLPDKPSIAVLPFRDLSDDSELFSEGLAEDIVAALSRFRWLTVVSPRSSFKFYASGERALVQVAAELRVQYLLDGSIRRSGSRMRVVARLTDTQMGRTEWSERFDVSEGDVFELQDEVSQRIVSAVAPASLSAEIERAQRRSPEDPDTWIEVMRAHSHLRRLTRLDNKKAQSILEAAVDRQPGIAMLASDYAISHVYDSLFGWSDSRRESIRLADSFARKATSIDRSDAQAFTALAFAAHINCAHQDAVSAFKTALRLNENLTEAHGYYAMTLGFVGDVEQVNYHVARALQLSPQDPMLTFWYDAVAMAAYMAGDFELAFEQGKRSVAENPDYVGGLRVLAAACGQLGRSKESSAAIARLFALDPNLTCEATVQQLPFRRPADADLYAQGLRAAGLP